ncbi:spin [Symbiodinium sp. CCMP2456]|nr:spin [Symbiodinium sp. CCMP2456]
MCCVLLAAFRTSERAAVAEAEALGVAMSSHEELELPDERYPSDLVAMSYQHDLAESAHPVGSGVSHFTSRQYHAWGAGPNMATSVLESLRLVQKSRTWATSKDFTALQSVNLIHYAPSWPLHRPLRNVFVKQAGHDGTAEGQVSEEQQKREEEEQRKLIGYNEAAKTFKRFRTVSARVQRLKFPLELSQSWNVSEFKFTRNQIHDSLLLHTRMFHPGTENEEYWSCEDRDVVYNVFGFLISQLC